MKINNKSPNLTPIVLVIALALGHSAVVAKSLVQTQYSSDVVSATAKVAEFGQEVVFVDAALYDQQTLLKAVPPGAEWIVLDAGRDGIVQIADALLSMNHVTAIHLLSHGEDGALLLGNSRFDESVFNTYQNQIEQIRRALVPGSELLLYGCNVAQSQKGKHFVEALALLLNADVAASNNVTQAQDWQLEISSGPIETATLAPQHYRGRLDIIAGDGSGGGGGAGFYGADGGDGGGDDDTLNGTDGSDVIFGDGSGGGGASGGIYSGGQGGSGNDILNGGAGNDILFGDGFDGSPSTGNDGGDGGYGGGGGGGSYAPGYSGGAGGIGAGDGGSHDGTYGSNGQPGQGSTGGLGYNAGSNGGENGDDSGGGGGWGGGNGGDSSIFGVNTNVANAYGLPGEAGGVASVTIVDDGNAIYSVVRNHVAGVTVFEGAPGGAGNDTLNGGPGGDELFGMGGADTFVFEISDAPSDPLRTFELEPDVDRIWDFTVGSDLIELKLGGVLASSTVIATAVANQQVDVPALGSRTLRIYASPYTHVIQISDVYQDLVAADFTPATDDNNAPIFISVPTILGYTLVGDTVRVINPVSDFEGGAVVSYQWKANGVAINGATSSSYELTSAEADTTVTVEITADDGINASVSVTTAGVDVTNPSGGGGSLSHLLWMLPGLIMLLRRLKH